MSLSSERLDGAVRLLGGMDMTRRVRAVTSQQSQPSQPKPPPLIISLESLHSMTAPSSTSVPYLYPNDPTHRLLSFAQGILYEFTSAGYHVAERSRLKLHATVINTRYIRQPPSPPPLPPPPSSSSSSSPPPFKSHFQTSRGQNQSHSPPIKIDARNLIETCRDWKRATHVVLDRVAICKMGARKVYGQDGCVLDEMYEEVVSVPLPTLPDGGV